MADVSACALNRISVYDTHSLCVCMFLDDRPIVACANAMTVCVLVCNLLCHGKSRNSGISVTEFTEFGYAVTEFGNFCRGKSVALQMDFHQDVDN